MTDRWTKRGVEFHSTRLKQKVNNFVIMIQYDVALVRWTILFLVFSSMLCDSASCYVCPSEHPFAHVSVGHLVPFWAVAPKGSMTYAFTHMGNFLLFSFVPPPPSGLYLSLEAHIPVSRPKSQSRGSNPSFEAKIIASRPKSQPRGPNSSKEASC